MKLYFVGENVEQDYAVRDRLQVKVKHKNGLKR